MKKIHLLSQKIISQIAAGEVIERPVYALKELIENAIDAGADTINIYIEESGLKKIVVTDNGEGMSLEDLKESFKPHTTSKISKTEELSQINTLGFRGEALSSIAAISRLTLSSRASNIAAGATIIVKNGKVEKVAPIGMPVGTSVIIEHLFHSHPVRKKFLRSVSAEFRLILNLVIDYALSYPAIHFSLVHNKKILLDLPPTDDLLTRIEKLLGRDIVSSLIPLNYKDTYVSISGFLAKPNVTTKTPSKQFIFINGRVVTDKKISQMIKSAYGTLLAHTFYPVCLLHFSLPFEMVDVNVHPRKEIVRFIDTPLLLDTIQRAVSQTLVQYDLTPDTNIESLFLSDAVGSTQSYAGRWLKGKKLPWKLSVAKVDYLTIFQLHNLYLFVAYNNGFLLIDQHAAHERILYEQLLDEFFAEKKKYTLFQFPKPGVFDLSLSEAELLLEHLEQFQKLGWDIEHFKNNSFVIRSLPVLFQDRDYVKLLREMLDDLQGESLKNNIDEISKRMIAYLACRGAIKAGDKLTKKQAKELVIQLEKNENNATCPHGRPTKVFVDLEKINRLFKR